MGARRRRVNQSLARGEGAGGAGGGAGETLPGEREAWRGRGRALPGERVRDGGGLTPDFLHLLLLLVGLALLVLWAAHRG